MKFPAPLRSKKVNHKGQLIGICEILVGGNLALMRMERKYTTAVNSLGSEVRQTQGGKLGLRLLHITSLSLVSPSTWKLHYCIVVRILQDNARPTVSTEYL